MTDVDTASIARGDEVERVRRERTHDYDPYANKTIDENLADLASVRETLRLGYSTVGPDSGFWYATTYDDISSVLRRNNRGFVSHPNSPFGAADVKGSHKVMIPIDIDGPAHQQYRKLLDPFFTPKAIAELEQSVRSVAVNLIDDFIEHGRCEFVPQFAFPFPGTTVMRLMGWPLEDGPMMSEWVRVLMHGLPGAPMEESNQARSDVTAKVHAYFDDQLERRRNEPTNDITSYMMSVELDGRRFTDEELRDHCALMMLAGLDTVNCVLGAAIVYLGRNQQLWTDMFASGQALDRAVEEFVRWGSPAVPTRTVTDEGVVVADVEIPVGERVHCPLGAANRDPQYYPEPDEVRLDRPLKPHIAFGLGPHRCIGSHLARMELRVAFEELHRRIPAFRLDDANPPSQHLGLTWGFEDIHILFEPGVRVRPVGDSA